MKSAVRVAGTAIGVILAMAFAAVIAAAAERKVGYRIVCHPANPTDVVEREFLEDAFLRKKTTWPSGVTIRPVDMTRESPVRKQFSAEVLRRSVDAVRSYWQQRIFAGRELPPPELDGDEAVIRYVLKERGSVGYVSDGATLGGAKVLGVR
jgi:hypothetical protein